VLKRVRGRHNGAGIAGIELRRPPRPRPRQRSPLCSLELDTLYATATTKRSGGTSNRSADGTTYVSPGDIRGEWLRDASAIVRPYIGALRNPQRSLIVARSRRAPGAQHLSIPTRTRFPIITRSSREVRGRFAALSDLVASDYTGRPKTRSVFTPTVAPRQRVLQFMHVEQHHDTRSHYTNKQLAARRARQRGSVAPGMSGPASGPRTSGRYHYNIPVTCSPWSCCAISARSRTTCGRRSYVGRRVGLSSEIQRVASSRTAP